jgi:hypothetical protein
MEASYRCKSVEGMQQQMLCYSPLGSLMRLACAIPQSSRLWRNPLQRLLQAIDALFNTHKCKTCSWTTKPATTVTTR